MGASRMADEDIISVTQAPEATTRPETIARAYIGFSQPWFGFPSEESDVSHSVLASLLGAQTDSTSSESRTSSTQEQQPSALVEKFSPVRRPTLTEGRTFVARR